MGNLVTFHPRDQSGVVCLRASGGKKYFRWACLNQLRYLFSRLLYGRDALVGIGLFLTHLAKFGKSISMLRASYPNYFISKNKLELTPNLDVDNILLKIKEKYKKHPINDIDGIKIEFEKEWVHLRKSNTEPIIRIYSESDSEAKAEHLAKKIIQDIKEVVTTPLP